MAIIAPWLQLPNFMGAAESGARIGLSRAQLDQEREQKAAELAQRASEAAGRLGLGGAELASGERTRMAQIAAGRETAASRLAQAARHYEDLNNLNQQKLGLSQDRIANLEGNRDAVNTLHQQQLDLAKQKAEGATKSAAERLAQAQETQKAITARLQQQLAAREAAKIPTMNLKIPGSQKVTTKHFIGKDTTETVPTEGETAHNVPLNSPLINQVLGAVPNLGTNYQGAASALLNPAAFRGPSSAGFSGPAHDEEADVANNATIRVKHPNGQTGMIPQSQLEAAVKEGYEPIQ